MGVAKLISLVFVVTGLFVLVSVSLPIVAFKVWELGINFSPNLLSPQKQTGVLGVSIQTTKENFPAVVSDIKRSTKLPFDTMKLSAEKLGIKDAVVLIDSNDLTKGLAHLPGSALPGERGNVFISGHSALPQLFIGEKNYGSIFANLNKLKDGDLIKISLGGSQFIYRVSGMKVVDPSDISVVYPPEPFGRYITLMTCVPPGLNTKRLVVLGKLI